MLAGTKSVRHFFNFFFLHSPPLALAIELKARTFCRDMTDKLAILVHGRLGSLDRPRLATMRLVFFYAAIAAGRGVIVWTVTLG